MTDQEQRAQEGEGAQRTVREGWGVSGLIPRSVQLGGEDGFEAALFVEVVDQNDGHDAQRAAAVAAGRHLPLQILNEAISEAIVGASTPRGFVAGSAAMRADELDAIVLRIAVERGPGGVPDANGFCGTMRHEQCFLYP